MMQLMRLSVSVMVPADSYGPRHHRYSSFLLTFDKIRLDRSRPAVLLLRVSYFPHLKFEISSDIHNFKDSDSSVFEHFMDHLVLPSPSFCSQNKTTETACPEHLVNLILRSSGQGVSVVIGVAY